MKFSEQADKFMPPPPGIRKEVLENPNLCRRYGRFVAAYDSDRQIGGLYSMDNREWILFFAILLEPFAARVGKTMAEIEKASLAEKPDNVN